MMGLGEGTEHTVVLAVAAAAAAGSLIFGLLFERGKKWLGKYQT
jgi:hypothetical protein